MKYVVLSLLLLLACTQAVLSQPAEIALVQTPQPKVLSFFADGYYAWSSNEPEDRMRSYTTQPLYHNSFALNLAMIKAAYSSDMVHGNIALQTGSFVKANYVGADKEYSMIQEASVGFTKKDIPLFESMSIDIGIFPSHIGYESLISRDNWTYTRSIIADFTPYYECGIKSTIEITPTLTLTSLVLNGWQNIVENNSSKAIGTQVQYKPESGGVVFNWSSFIGNEQPDSMKALPRLWNNFWLQANWSPVLQSVVMSDIGMQKNLSGSQSLVWSLGAIVRYSLNGDKVKVAARGEIFKDKDDFLVHTGSPNGYQATSFSLNLDCALQDALLWRTELRYLHSLDAVYPSAKGISDNETLIVSSLSFYY